MHFKGTLAERKHEDPKGNSETSITKSQRGKGNDESDTPSPIDWKPNEKCYFCVDGKLLTVNEKGDLVAESGPAPSEAELAHRVSTFAKKFSITLDRKFSVRINKLICNQLFSSIQTANILRFRQRFE